jgi:hypothetical protein
VLASVNSLMAFTVIIHFGGHSDFDVRPDSGEDTRHNASNYWHPRVALI